jgi:hypothetical protein
MNRIQCGFFLAALEFVDGLGVDGFLGGDKAGEVEGIGHEERIHGWSGRDKGIWARLYYTATTRWTRQGIESRRTWPARYIADRE